MKYISSLILITILGSCVNFKPGWEEFNTQSNSGNVEELLKTAYELESKAASSESLQLLIDAFKKVEQVDPKNYIALYKIGNYYTLMGAAYTDKTKDKKACYRDAIKYCEKAMSVNTEFVNEIKIDNNISNAIKKLSIHEIDAMGFWYTARFYYFKECLKPLGRMMNSKLIVENNLMIDRIDELDKNWAGGGNYFSRALYYIALPQKLGGSKDRARKEFLKAIEVGPQHLVNRWGRAKYLYNLTGDKEGFQTDLKWIISQDPKQAGNSYPWNVYFQEDARKMLNNQK